MSQADLFGERPSKRTAVISECGRYRYRLDRSWPGGAGTVCWIMLNPSTADGERDDATLRKITAYSRRWGYGGLVVVNLFAWRATDPKALRGDDEFVGYPAADMHIAAALDQAAKVVCGWGGSAPKHHAGRRIAQVLQAIARAGLEPHALAVTKHGDPCHPLYLPAAKEPRPLADLREEPS